MNKLFVLLTIVAFTVQVNALVTLTHNKTDFFNDTGATSEGLIPNLGGIGASGSIGNVAYSVGPGASQLHFGIGNSSDWTSLMAGHDIAISGPESMNADFANPIFAVGFDTVDGTGFDSNFSIAVKSSGVTLETFAIDPTPGTVLFIGIESTQAFDRIEIVETAGNSEDDFYGVFFTSSTPAVPEPSTWILAVLAVGFFVRKTR